MSLKINFSHRNAPLRSSVAFLLPQLPSLPKGAPHFSGRSPSPIPPLLLPPLAGARGDIICERGINYDYWPVRRQEMNFGARDNRGSRSRDT